MNEQFEEWWNNQDKYTNSYVFSTISWHQFTEDAFPFEYKWGVYLEFFDSVGIVIEIITDDWKESGFWVIWVNGSHLKTDEEKTTYHTRAEAQQEAIKKAFEILNSSKPDKFGRPCNTAILFISDGTSDSGEYFSSPDER